MQDPEERQPAVAGPAREAELGRGARVDVLVDRKGLVRSYAPTRLSEAELSRRIEELLAE